MNGRVAAEMPKSHSPFQFHTARIEVGVTATIGSEIERIAFYEIEFTLRTAIPKHVAVFLSVAHNHTPLAWYYEITHTVTAVKRLSLTACLPVDN